MNRVLSIFALLVAATASAYAGGGVPIYIGMAQNALDPPIYLMWYAFVVYFTIVLLCFIAVGRWAVRRHRAHYHKLGEARELYLRDEHRRYLEEKSRAMREVKELARGGDSAALVSYVELFESVEFDDLGRISLAPSCFAFGDIVDSVISEIKETNGFQQIVTNEQNTDKQIFAHGDTLLLKMVINTLLNNGCRSSVDSSPVVISWSVEGERLMVEVIYSGSWVTFEALAHIFDIFNGGGEYALAFVKQIVERHGGEIAVESGEGYGTRFILSMPIVASAEQVENYHLALSLAQQAAAASVEQQSSVVEEQVHNEEVGQEPVPNGAAEDDTAEDSAAPIENAESDDELFLSSLNAMMLACMSNDSIDINHFARELGLNRSLFFRRVKELTNRTPFELLKDFRLTRAAEMLDTGTHSVEEVYSLVGFKSRTHFSRLFKEKFDLSPGKYIEAAVARLVDKQ